MGGDIKTTEYGVVARHFDERKLKDLCVDKTGIQTGPFGSQLHKEDYVSNGTPIITVEHLAGNRISHENLPNVSDEDKARLAKYHLATGDLVFSRVGSVDRNALVGPEEDGWLFSGRCLRVRVDKSQIDPIYLSYFFSLEGFKEHIRSVAVGATMPSINTKILSDVSIYFPPLLEQKAIAQILGSLDDKIELNRRMNATLEGMAQALFKSWFVDFDPVIDNALAAGNPIPDELAARAEVRRQALADGTANREVAKSFPAAFQESEEMGWIPEGWKVRPLDKIANYQNGLALQKFRPKPGEIPLPVVKIAQLKTGDAIWEELASPSIKPECILDNGDIVFSWSGSLMVTLWCGGRAALNQHLFKVTSQEFPKWLYHFWTKKHLADFQRIAADKAVTMGHIKRSHLAEAMCSLPTVELIEEGTRILSPIIDQLIKNDLESRTLACLRDTLLPQLISGELRIPEAEQLSYEVWA